MLEEDPRKATLLPAELRIYSTTQRVLENARHKKWDLILE